METIVSASILNADMSCLGPEIKRAESAGADMIHLDVMDGVFVDCITYGDYVVKSLRRHTGLIFDTHLMVYDPSRLIPSFAAAGSDIITIHAESRCNVTAALRTIRGLGRKSGVSLNPDTPAESIFPYLPDADIVLIMSVSPGYGGQGFIPETISKINAVKAEIIRLGTGTIIEVDGGINEKTAPEAKSAGADILVAGSFLFGSADMADAVKILKS